MDGWTTKWVCHQLSQWGLEENVELAWRAKIDGPVMMALHKVDALCSQLSIVKMGHRKQLAIAIRHLDDDNKCAFKLAISVPIHRAGRAGSHCITNVEGRIRRGLSAEHH
jgi:hypothetical protein